MTERENFMRVINGETPAWAPRFSFGTPDPYATKPVPCVNVGYMLWSFKPDGKGGLIDMFGVPYTPTAETGGMFLPTPNKFILDDVRRWREVIKVPSLEGIDWEGEAKKSLEGLDGMLKGQGLTRNDVATILGTHVGYFQMLCNFMGFSEGLMALIEEPDAVHELYSYLADFYDEITRQALTYFKPDILGITDDTATMSNPFMSLKVFRDVIKPYHARLGKLAMDRGLPVMMHNCGRCEDFIDDWREYGVTSWNPAQVSNDLDGIKRKYGNKLTLIGCWDSQGPAGWPGAKEELVRQEVRNCIDRYGAGGGFMFLASTYGPVGDEELENRRRWITTEYEAYRDHPYK